MIRLIVGLGITQLISWAALIYTITVLGGAMARDFAISDTAVFGAFSASLLVSGLVGPRVGATIDRRGGRVVLAWGSAIAAASLMAVALAPSTAWFVFAWVCVGVARGMTLYEAAFATLSQHAGDAFRRAVTIVTLFGGFAGTLAFPFSLVMLEHFGWRAAIAAFAVAELAICLPLHWWCIPAGPGKRAAAAPHEPRNAGAPADASTRHGFLALTISFAFTAFITSAVAAHVVGLLQSTGLSATTAVWIASLIGPMQVAGRLVEFALGRTRSAVAIGIATLVLLIVSLVTLWLADASLAIGILFAAMYGCANGVQTIVRGTVPAELFGHRGYGSMIGRLSVASFAARAVAPVTLPLVASLGLAVDLSAPLLVTMALLALSAYVVAIRRVRWHAGRVRPEIKSADPAASE